MRKEQWQTKSHIQPPIYEVRKRNHEEDAKVQQAKQRHIYDHQCTA